MTTTDDDGLAKRVVHAAAAHTSPAIRLCDHSRSLTQSTIMPVTRSTPGQGGGR